MTDWIDHERARLLREADEINAILRRSVWGPPRRILSAFGDACGCAVIFALLWAGLAILT